MDQDCKNRISLTSGKQFAIPDSKRSNRQNTDNYRKELKMGDPNVESYENIQSSVVAITQNMNAENQKLIFNESFTIYTKMEIDKVEKDVKELDEKCDKLNLENALLETDLKELDRSIDINRQAIKVKRDTVNIVKENIDKLLAETEERDKTYQKVYNKYLEKYKVTRKLFEDHNPLFRQSKTLQNESLKLEVEKKMLQVKINEIKRQIQFRRDIQWRMFTNTYVNFAKGVLNYHKSGTLHQKVEEEENKRENLLKELYEVKLLAAKKEEELQYHKPKALKETHVAIELVKDPAWNLNEINSRITTIPSVNLTSSLCDSNILLREKQLQSEKNLEQIRARFDRGQQQWNQQLFPMPQKRTFAATNFSTKHPNSKLSKIPPPNNSKNIIPTGAKSTNKRNNLPITNIGSNPNVNILSVHTIDAKNKEDSKHTVQIPQYPQSQSVQKSQSMFANENFQVPPTPQDLKSQILPQPQAINKNLMISTPSVKNNPNLYPQSFFQNQPPSMAFSQSQAGFSSYPQRVPPQSQIKSSQALGQTQPRYYTQNDSSQSQIKTSQELITSPQSQFRYSACTQNNLPQAQLKSSQEIINESSYNMSSHVESQQKASMGNLAGDNLHVQKQAGEGVDLRNPVESAVGLQKITNVVDNTVTSHFFVDAKKPNEKTEDNLEQNTNTQFMSNQMGINSSYFGTLPYVDTLNESEGSMKMDHAFSPVFLSPVHSGVAEEENKSNDGAQSSAFNFNFGQSESTQPNGGPFFGANPFSGPFNMF